ncbi:hypothetical protein HK102_004814 [Quaeritorhiza haematococci]|nr:hypothetical protein HK102_004814 [Quaeritorhiza haematococci]
MPVNIALIGPGLVGSELLSQLAAHQSRLSAAASTTTTHFNLVALANSKRMLLSPTPLPLDSWATAFSSSSATTTLDLTKLADHCAQPSLSPCVVVDCTSSDAVAGCYPAWVRKGLHVVTPNKKGFSGGLGLWKEIREAQRVKGAGRVYHESTVGAGLPILSTLNDLVATGDEIVKIEGIFSGTLSYIFNTFNPAGDVKVPKFSEVVSVAKSKGYTEPDPRDDLNGMDVARKVVILGRVAGVDLSLDTLPVENIVPESLRAVSTADEFMQRLPEFDSHFEKLKAEAAAEKAVLRYVGLVDPVNGKSSVKLMRYDSSHPFASLKGSDNIIAFTTKRFPNPLIIQGAGAGAAVTAFGIFSDLLKIAGITGN